MRGLLKGGLNPAFAFIVTAVMCFLFSWEACASQPKIGLDQEWRPIEGLDENPAPRHKADERPREQRCSEPEAKTFTVNGISFKMSRIPAGEFIMGSPASEPGRDNDETQHCVRITKDYWLGETEVT